MELGASSGALVLGILAAVPGGPGPGALVDRLDAGWAVVHARPSACARRRHRRAGGLVVWISAAVTDELAFRHDASLGALAPGVMVLIWITALGDPDGALARVGPSASPRSSSSRSSTRCCSGAAASQLGPTRLVDAPGCSSLGALAGTLAVAVGVGVTAAPALPGGDTPLFESGGLGRPTAAVHRPTAPRSRRCSTSATSSGAARSQELFTVRAETADYWRITALDEYRSVAGGQWTLTAEGDDAVGEGLDEKVPRTTH